MSDKETYYYFLGIGGIGMSALARYYLSKGNKVYGYDKTPSALTDKLIEEGAQISFEDDPNSVPDECRVSDNTTVVYTPAIPISSKLFQFFKEGYQLKKRAVVLGDITKETVNLSVAGTHGKTTTSCLLSSIFKQSDKRFSAFLGGISADLGSNYYFQDGESEHFSITEADEFDRSFLHLAPSGAIITSTDADHLDIYKEKDEMERTYGLFAGLVSEPTQLFRAQGTELKKGQTYSVEGPANYHADVTDMNSTGSHFSIMQGSEVVLGDLFLSIPGQHNLENAIGAALLARKVGVKDEAIAKGLSTFKGIRRRFEVVLVNEQVTYIDDYAHHPSELEAIISSVKQIYKGRHITAVFQPHLFSRTQDFLDGFAEELSKVDSLILLPIYPARELPIPGIDSQLLLDKTSLQEKLLVQKENLLSALKEKEIDVLLTLGAGDIDRLVEPIKLHYGE